MRDRLNSERCSTYLKALAEPDRLRIVQWLQQHGPVSVGVLSRGLGSPLANVSHHLKQLRVAGLVAATKEGRFVMYSMADGVVSGRAKDGGLDLGCCRLEPVRLRVRGGRAPAKPSKGA